MNKKTVFIAAIFLVIGFFWYKNHHYQYLISTPVDPTDSSKISFLIKKGDTLNEISQNLQEKELILDAGALKDFLKSNALDRKIIPGRFFLTKAMPIQEIAETITNQKLSEFIITIPEGSTIVDIDKKLVETEIIKPGEFIEATKKFSDYEKYPFLEKEKIISLPHPLEGFLFPDTYFLDSQNFQSQDLIQLMLKNFQNRLGDDLNKTGEKSLFEVITMASIVEKEVRTEKDLPIVAGILWKRLTSNWQLGADATLLYLKADRSINYQDLQEDTPYNTRKHLGLPPGPISNPGLKSIMATLHPEESPYYFYLTKPGSGEVIYAATNDEHNLNKQKYL